MFQAILIALAISIDSFAMSMSYGIKKIKIPKLSILIIDLVTVCTLGASMYFGHLIRRLISPNLATTISFVILLCLGCYLMIQGYVRYLYEKNKNHPPEDNKVAKLSIPNLGIMIDIAIDFTKADMDISGNLEWKEAIYLGAVLSLDALGAGFGSALGGINPLQFLIIVFAINLFSLSYGMYLGRTVKNYSRNLKTSLLPGAILIFVGFLRWF